MEGEFSIKDTNKNVFAISTLTFLCAATPGLTLDQQT